MGTHQVGALIVATRDGFQKSIYRRFNLQSTQIAPGDDYGMFREVLTRRLKRLLHEYPQYTPMHWPDILLIDGGKGQLSTVMQVLELFELADRIRCVAISKGPDRNAGREEFHMIGKKSFILPAGDAVLFYLQTVRDEVHRFAIGSHRAKRGKALTHSSLSDVPSIGMKRKTILLQHFGSAKAVSEATVEELLKVSGVSKALAEDIYNFFHS
jgi:excinuclease ABC subunit C